MKTAKRLCSGILAALLSLQIMLSGTVFVSAGGEDIITYTFNGTVKLDYDVD